MRKLRFLVFAMIAAGSAIVFQVSGSADPVAQARGAEPGDSCTVLHATTVDADGRTMWCNPTMTGAHSLVWQYGGPA